MKTRDVTINEFPMPMSPSTEMQVIADIIALPETLIEAERILTDSMFADDKCRDAYEALRAMAKNGEIIDLPSAYGKIDRDLMKGVVPSLANVGSATSAIQHYSVLRDLSIKRRCYGEAVKLLMRASDTTTTAQDLIGCAGSLSDTLRKEMDVGRNIQHISAVINELGSQMEEAIKDKASGKVLRVPTGFYTMDIATYGGWNRGNLIILAARPSVGKTAVMLQMARAAANAGKAVNLYNLEMTNTELAQRFLFSTEHITPIQMARADIDWHKFELASGAFTSKPIYLSDSLFGEDEIIANITLNVQSGKCDMVFIDYLGLVSFADKKSQPSYAIAGFTKRLKNLAKTCKIPIVLLCQLNRASASEKRPPALHDLRDSGSIEQDADIVLMLERAGEDLDSTDVNMWVRKNRQGKAGDYKVELEANGSFTSFRDKDEPPLPSFTDDFNDSDIPF